MSFTDYSIAGLNFRLCSQRDIRITRSFEPFLGNADKIDWTIFLEELECRPIIPKQEIYSDYAVSVRQDDDGDCRCYFDPTYGDQPYAVSRIIRDKEVVNIRFLDRDRNYYFSDVTKAFSHAAFEELLILKKRLILHASLVDTPYGGILFSGRSGIGKSTQAELWRKYEGCTVINGDRPILYRAETGWRAYGSPYAGSSECYVNGSAPITAIMMLEQGSKCVFEKMSMADAFRKLYAQTVINSWNDNYVLAACNLLLELAEQVPVYRMVCTPERESVEAAKALLNRAHLHQNN